MENTLTTFQKKKKFGIYEAALASLLFIIFNFVFLRLYYLLPNNVRASKPVYYLASFLLEGMFALTAITIATTRKINLVEAAGMNKKINGKLVGLGFLISLVCLLGFGRITTTFLIFLENIGYKSVLPSTTIDNFLTYLVYVVISCLAPAVFEELLFRGVIASGLKERGFKVALFVSAAIFTFMHGNAEQTIHQFIVGLVLGYVFIKSGNLWLGVIIHFFNNFISVTEMFLFNVFSSTGAQDVVEDVTTTPTTNKWVSLLISAVVAAVFAYVGYLIIKNLIKKFLNENEALNGTKQEVLENVSNEVNSHAGREVETEVKTEAADETPVEVTVKNEENQEQITESEKTDLQSSNSEKPVDKLKGLSVPTLVFFTLSAAYLAFDWVLSLLNGFGLF